MCYARRKIEGGVGALRESVDTNFLKPNGQSRNLNVYGIYPILLWLSIAFSDTDLMLQFCLPNSMSKP